MRAYNVVSSNRDLFATTPIFHTFFQGCNGVYGIRDQRYIMGRDQGSQPRDLEDQDQQCFSWTPGSG